MSEKLQQIAETLSQEFSIEVRATGTGISYSLTRLSAEKIEAMRVRSRELMQSLIDIEMSLT